MKKTAKLMMQSIALKTRIINLCKQFFIYLKVLLCISFLGIDEALFFLVKKGDLDTTKKLIMYGANVNRKNQKGNTALHVAIQNGHIALTQYWLEKYNKINTKNHAGNTVLHLELEHGYTDLAVKCINKGANIHAKNGCNLDALHIALLNHLEEIPQELCATNTISTATHNADGHTELYLAVLQNNYNEVKRLISQGHNIDARNDIHETPLHLAVEHRYFKII